MTTKTSHPQQLLQQLKTAQEIVDIDLLSWPRSTLASKEIQQIEAKASIRSLQEQYGAYLLQSAAVMVLQGSEAAQNTFQAIAKAEGHTVNVDAGRLYRELAEPTEASLGDRREWGVSQFQQLLYGLMTVARDLGLTEITLPRPVDWPVTADAAATVAHVRNIIRHSPVGDTLQALYLRHLVMLEAIRLGWDEAVVPVLVAHAVPEEAQVLAQGLYRAGIVVDVPETVDRALVLKTFSGLRGLVAKIRGYSNGDGSNDSNDNNNEVEKA